MLNLLIESYIKRNNLTPAIIPGYIPFKDFNKVFGITSGIIFITELVLIGKVEIAENLNNGLLTIESESNITDYSELIKISEVGGLVQLQSDIITMHSTAIKINLNNNSLFESIVTGHLKYIKII